MLAHLLRRSRALLAAAIAAGILAGVCTVTLLAQINGALSAPDAATRAALIGPFVAVSLAAMLTHTVSALLFERLSQRAAADMRLYISGRVMGAEYRRLEEIGGPTVQSALSEHSANVASFFVTVPILVVNTIIVLGCLGYLAWLSTTVFAMAVLVIGLGSLGYHLAHLRALKHLNAAAREQDKLFGLFRSLIEGAKELRLHREKRAAFADGALTPAIEAVRRLRVLGMSIFVISANWGNFLIYAFIGLVLFLLVGDGPDQAAVMTGFALIFVYMVTPLQTLLLNIPRANLARAAASRIDEITRDMAAMAQEAEEAVPSAAAPSRIDLLGVTHRYYHEGRDDLFTLGPIDLSLHAEELVFLVGGNGSGKTTLAKLLVGLYAPDDGRILLDGRPVEDGNRDRYRQHFATVFSDFHLFDQLLAVRDPEREATANRLIERLRLEHKVRVENGAFTTRELSQGQRKRLALVEARLDDRPFMVFDEWAADQDPAFKEVFYRDILAELRAEGKAVVVISHDDRYFHLADRVIRMEDGRLIDDRRMAAE